MKHSTCRNCGEHIALRPYAPGMEGPVVRWQHDDSSRLCNLPGNRQSLDSLAAPVL